MRRAIDRRSNKLKDVLLEPTMRKEFLKGAKAEEKAVVKAFVEINKENMLKTKPKVNRHKQSPSPLPSPSLT